MDIHPASALTDLQTTDDLGNGGSLLCYQLPLVLVPCSLQPCC